MTPTSRGARIARDATAGGKLSRPGRTPTTLPALREIVQSVRRPRHVVFEEGQLADWMYRGLLADAECVVSCDPRRNALIAKQGDKDDPIDAQKLNQLYRGGFTQAVHHPESFKRAAFKRLVVSYHETVVRRGRHSHSDEAATFPPGLQELAP